MAGCCPQSLCPQVQGLPQDGAVTPNDFAVVFDPTLGCNAGLKLKRLPNENEVLQGVGAPTLPPADPTENKTWFNTTTDQTTHFWEAATSTWVPIVGSFPIIKKCDNTNAAATDRFITANAGSTVANASLGGATPTARVLWTHDNNGLGCPAELTAPADRCTAVYPSADLVLGALADNTVGWVKPTQAERPVFRTVATTTTLNPAVEQGIFISAAGTVNLATPVATNLCSSTRVWVKRTTNDPTVVIRVSAAAGIDGAPSNSIQLGTSSSFGALTGEGAVFQFDGTTWRIISAY
jgi:hypothetical protein